MDREFVPYNIALALKELGFNEECLGYYNGNPHNLQYMYNGKPEKFTDKRMGVSGNHTAGWISAPLYQQAFRWFREKYHIVSYIYFDFDDEWCFNINGKSDAEDKGYHHYGVAELECLDKLIEICRNK